MIIQGVKTSVSWVFPQHHRMRIPRHPPGIYVRRELTTFIFASIASIRIMPVDPCHIFVRNASFSKGKIWDLAWIYSRKVNFVAFFLHVFFCNDDRFSGDLRSFSGNVGCFFFLEGTRGFLLVVPMCLVNVYPGKKGIRWSKSDSAWKGVIEAGAGKNVQVPFTMSWNVGGSKPHHFKLR